MGKHEILSYRTNSYFFKRLNTGGDCNKNEPKNDRIGVVTKPNS